ncbi:HU family DNA-binding protein [Thiorhodovibrio frisius]|uniref:Bacterial nucleoid DNA-binding protein n=1 Tax=Thiorhodovibrio frisius TaxID=631362 RepID=H8YZD0_9GAMM|nr:HU family DNA-binding protein [Thiorhodovibrio frisius]EIC22057.1 bacterial nucleoid DNA-binding protein [Thiorhodovibrio frisius]WPL24348.1 DNA-binding protein HU-beta [Thiorhodovibrio frisius]
MNKSEIVDTMAEKADISKTAAAKALDGFIDAITHALKEGDTVSIIGFGNFVVKERAARTGRNPQTGASIQIAASKSPSFKAGKALKDAIK